MIANANVPCPTIVRALPESGDEARAMYACYLFTRHMAQALREPYASGDIARWQQEAVKAVDELEHAVRGGLPEDDNDRVRFFNKPVEEVAPTQWEVHLMKRIEALTRLCADTYNRVSQLEARTTPPPTDTPRV